MAIVATAFLIVKNTEIATFKDTACKHGTINVGVISQQYESDVIMIQQI